MARPVVAAGQLADGRSWRIEAWRDGPDRVCSVPTLVGGPRSGREECERPPEQTTFGSIRVLTPPTPVIFVVVSSRTERVRFSATDGTSLDVPTLGSEANLGARFFVAPIPRGHAMTMIAVGPGGEVLDRRDFPPFPGP